MWALLSDPGLAAHFDFDNYLPLRRLLEQLSRREYAGQLCAFNSLFNFFLTTAPTYHEADGHNCVGIEFIPDRLFRVSYSVWVSPTRNPKHQTEANRDCELQEVGAVIDPYVLRLLLSREHVEAEQSSAADGRTKPAGIK